MTLSAEDGSGRPRHRHRSLVLGLVTAGGRRIETRQGDVLVAAGEGFCLPPGLVHACRAEGERCAYLAISLERGEGEAAAPLRWRDASLASALLRLAESLVLPGEPEEYAARQQRERLAEVLARLDILAVRRPRPEEELPAAVRRAVELLAASGDEPPSLNELAQACGMERYALHRAFVRALGLPPHAWAVQDRLDKAKALLRAGLGQAEAALAVGFCDQSHMHRQFLRLVGHSPGQYAGRSQPGQTGQTDQTNQPGQTGGQTGQAGQGGPARPNDQDKP